MCSGSNAISVSPSLVPYPGLVIILEYPPLVSPCNLTYTAIFFTSNLSYNVIVPGDVVLCVSVTLCRERYRHTPNLFLDLINNATVIIHLIIDQFQVLILVLRVMLSHDQRDPIIPQTFWLCGFILCNVTHDVKNIAARGPILSNLQITGPSTW